MSVMPDFQNEEDFAQQLLGEEYVDESTNEGQVEDSKDTSIQEDTTKVQNDKDNDKDNTAQLEKTQEQETKEETEPKEESLESKEEVKPTRGQRRYQQLVDKIKQKEELLKTVTQSRDSEVTELTPEQLHQLIEVQVQQKTMEAEVQRQREELAESFEQDLAKVFENYPELDSESDQYDQEKERLILAMVEGPDGTPRMLPSEAIQKLEMYAEGKVKKQASQKVRQLQRQEEEAVLSPNTTQRAKPVTTDEEIARLAKEDPTAFTEKIFSGELNI
jgi:hypothetical protein